MKIHYYFLLPTLGLSSVCSAARNTFSQSDNYRNATPVISNSSVPFPWSYLGCYADKASAPVLNSEVFTDDKLSEKTCVKRCSHLGYTFAGLKHGTECHCGYAMSSAVKKSDCNKALTVFTNGLAPPTVNGWSTLGCYSDNEDSRTLHGFHSSSRHNSVHHCISTCHKKRFDLAGVESGGDCYCGNKLRHHAAPIPASRFCNIPCTGNRTEICGGEGSLNLYTRTGPKGPACSYDNTGEFSCPADVPYLISNGTEFCTSYISYVPPTSTKTFTTTPATSTISQTTTVHATVAATNTITATAQSTSTQFQTNTLARRGVQAAVETPAYLSTWAPSRISAACSSVATDTITNTVTQTAPVPLTTQVATNTISDTQTAIITLTTTAITVVTTTACQPCPTLMQNSDFESGLNFWNMTLISDGSVIATNRGASHGQGSLAAILPTYGAAVARQDLATTPGTRYDVSVDYWFSAPMTNCYLNAFINGNWFWSFSPRYVPASVNNWQTGTPYFIASDCFTKLEIQFVCTAGENVEMRVDNLRWSRSPSC